MRGLIALSLLFLSTVSHADAVASLERFFQTTRSLSGEFTQQVFQNEGGKISQSKGKFELARPDRFRWAYLKPHEQILVSDGRALWIYDKDLAQVTVRRVGKALGQAPIALLGGATPLTKNYSLKDAGNSKGLEWVKLSPKQLQNAQFQKILLGLSNGLIRKMILFDSFGHRTVITFEKVHRNIRLPEKDFQFKAPKGVDVVDMM